MIRLSSVVVGGFAALAALAGFASAGCSRARDERSGDAARGGELVVFNAGSLARPLRAVLDTFAARTGARVSQENAGSMETARKLTELGNIPDVIAVADFEIFPQLLIPEYVSWYALFARNRMVVAYTDRSRFAPEMTTPDWWHVLLRDGVEVGRADPDLDPAGYRALLLLQLAERHYGEPGLAGRLLHAAPRRNVRPKAADLVGLLQAGELDYIWSYESVAKAAGLRYVTLPARIDLGTPAESTFYRLASVRVAGKTPRDTLVFRGEPIAYALSVPHRAPHPALAARFAAFLLSGEGRALLERERLDALDAPVIVGTGVPAAIDSLSARH